VSMTDRRGVNEDDECDFSAARNLLSGSIMINIFNKILAALSAPHHIEHQDLHVTASVGIGVYPDDGTDAETLLSSADLALFNAKASGRSNHQFFQRDMTCSTR